MQALLLDAYADDPATLAPREVSRPVPAADEVLVALRASAINPSDLKNARGGMRDHTRLPRILGRDFAGVVVAGPADLLGAHVYGTGGDLGFTRDGAHAEMLAVPRAAVVPLPAGLSFTAAATVGVAYVSAAEALRIAGARPGETVLVTGATGAVGGAALQLACRLGAHAIGIVRRPEDRDAALMHGADAALVADDSLGRRLAETAPDGVHVGIDAVGGALFEEVLAALRPGGRIVAMTVGAGGPRVELDLLRFYRRELALFGLNTLTRDAVACARVLAGLADGFASGALRAQTVAATYPLAEAGAAYVRAAGGERGKMLLTFAETPGC